MNASSVVVLAVVLALAAFAAWRTRKKGVPCECGGTCRERGKCACRHHS